MAPVQEHDLFSALVAHLGVTFTQQTTVAVDAVDSEEHRCRFLRVANLISPVSLQYILRDVGNVEEFWYDVDAFVVKMTCTRDAAMAKCTLNGQIVFGVQINVDYDRDAADQLKAWAEFEFLETKKRKRDAEAEEALASEKLRRELAEEEALYGPQYVEEDAQPENVASPVVASLRPPAHSSVGDRGGSRRPTREIAIPPSEINIVPVPKAPPPGSSRRAVVASAGWTGVQLAENARWGGSPDLEADAAHARLAKWKAERAATAAGGGRGGPRSLAEQWQQEQRAETPQEKPKFRPGYSHELAAKSSATVKRSTKPPTRSL